MKSRCPNCQTVFRVTPEQLRARAGKVRCGQCQAVFNALDSLLEFGLSTKYKMYDNFTVYVETNYDALFLDKSASVWGNSKMNGKSDRSADAWNTAVTFVYQF